MIKEIKYNRIRKQLHIILDNCYINNELSSKIKTFAYQSNIGGTMIYRGIFSIYRNGSIVIHHPYFKALGVDDVIPIQLIKDIIYEKYNTTNKGK